MSDEFDLLDLLFDWGVIQLTREEFEEFRDVQIRRRYDWPATFSCNGRGEVWPFATYSHTSESERVQLKGVFPVLDLIVERLLLAKSDGGRFHINDQGVFLAHSRDQIAEFEIL